MALSAAAALAAISLSPGSTQAFVVNVGGVQYDVTAFTGTYNANTSKFQTVANGGVMPWWGNCPQQGCTESLARQFADALAGAIPAGTVAGAIYGPSFGYQEFYPNADGSIDMTYYTSDRGFGQGPGTSTGDPGKGEVVTWAQAVELFPQSAEVSGPLPALGAAAAFGFSRKLRKNIKFSTKAVSSSYFL